MQLATAIKVNTVEVTMVKNDGTRDWLYVSIPNGWDDVEQLPKLLEWDGRTFEWMSWNSDSLYSCYREVIGQSKYLKF
jgi:hypothetical protein